MRDEIMRQFNQGSMNSEFSDSNHNKLKRGESFDERNLLEHISESRSLSHESDSKED